MRTRTRFEARLRSMGVAAILLCLVGAAASVYVVLVRVPALSRTKMEALGGTLMGVAVGLLFGVAALLINLTLMVRRAGLRGELLRGGADPQRFGHTDPGTP